MKKHISLLLSLVLMFSCVLPCLISEADAAGTLYWPVPGHTSMSRGFSSDHQAIDITDGGVNGATVIAAMGGTVHRIYLCGSQHYGDYHDCNGFGTGLVIKGDDGKYYHYAHMQAGSIPTGQVYYGAYVPQGATIGRVGTTGNSTGPHLHFSISTGPAWYENHIDPLTQTYSYTPGSNPVAPVDPITWTNSTVVPKDTDAYVYIKANAAYTGNFDACGIIILDANGNEVTRKVESPFYNSNYMEIWYNLTAETGAVLTPGTKYFYQFQLRFNGSVYKSEILSFTTTGGCTAHNYSWTVTQNATCQINGAEEGVCTNCGYTIVQSTPSIGHDYKATQVVSPTCSEQGYTVYTCTMCSRSTTDQTTPSIEHDYKATQVISPTCTEQGYTVYTCTMCSQTKQDSFTVPTCPSAQFSDAPAVSNWAHAGIDFAVSRGLFNGVSDTLFDTAGDTTRAMLVTVLWRYAGSPQEGSNVFSDVPAGKWYEDAIAWANANGVVNGVGEGKFDPSGCITRQQMATILYRYTTAQGVDTSARTSLNDFPDHGDVSGYAYEAMQWAVAEGLINGSGGNLLPKGNATRAQVATILMRYIENIME